MRQIAYQAMKLMEDRDAIAVDAIGRGRFEVLYWWR
jgi:hypothetical protein